MRIQLYVTECAPNGTNDLLIVKDGEIVDCLSEATFGIDVTKCANQAAIPDGTNWLYDPSDCDLSDSWLVGEVSLKQVQSTLAVHPGLSAKDASARLAKLLIKAA